MWIGWMDVPKSLIYAKQRKVLYKKPGITSNSRATEKHTSPLAMYMSMLPQGSHINKGLAVVVIVAEENDLCGRFDLVRLHLQLLLLHFFSFSLRFQ